MTLLPRSSRGSVMAMEGEGVSGGWGRRFTSFLLLFLYNTFVPFFLLSKERERERERQRDHLYHIRLRGDCA